MALPFPLSGIEALACFLNFAGTAAFGAYVVLRVDNTPAAEAILKAAGISTLSDDDVKSM